MVELCLMASHGYPPGLGVGFHQDHASNRVSEVRFMFILVLLTGFMGCVVHSFGFMFTFCEFWQLN